jgi:hypothetical protein
MMDNICLDDALLKNLENISRKLASPEDLEFTEEERLVIAKIRQYYPISPLITQFFMGNVISDLQSRKKE